MFDFFPRFTISVWMYLQEPCSGPGLCGIIHHRNEDFLTPLVALTTTGKWGRGEGESDRVGGWDGGGSEPGAKDRDPTLGGGGLPYKKGGDARRTS